MIRCRALHDPDNPHTQCFRDPGHDGPHLRYAEPERPPIEWFAPVVVSIVDRIKERIRL